MDKQTLALFLTIAGLIIFISFSSDYYQAKVAKLERELIMKSLEVENMEYQFRQCTILYRGI